VRVLGIDCGSECTGYGVIDSDGRRHRLVACGAIKTSRESPLSVRLEKIHSGLAGVLQANQPQAVAVENVFYAVNVKTALKLAHVRGVALLAAAEAGLAVGEYSPLEIKGSVVGFGRATKSQVQMMVSSLLGLTDPVKPFDASDALAVAICHAVAEVTRSKLVSRRTAHV
jgi:crossover junction endodeoxyribonuclease RuvC